MTPEEYKTLTESIQGLKNDLSKEIRDVKNDLDSKLERMDDREIKRVKDLYDHIGKKIESSVAELKSEIDKKVSKELFHAFEKNTDQRINFVWKVIFWAGGPMLGGLVGLAFSIFAK